MLKKHRESGSIAAKQGSQQTQTKLNAYQLAVLEQLVEETNDATLAELRYHLEQKTGVLIGRSTEDRMLTLLNLSVKKKHSIPRKKRVNVCHSNELSSGN